MLSKTDYLLYKQCPKALWLKYKSNAKETDSPARKAAIARGNEVNQTARALFPNGVLIPFGKSEMIAQTKQAISEGVQVIYEASFEAEGMLVRCDILVRKKTGWELYEVKSAASVKQRHVDDITIQAYILQKSGLDVSRIHLVYINNEYKMKGQLDVTKLFLIEDMTNVVKGKMEVGSVIKSMKDTLAAPSYQIDIGIYCEKYGKENFPCGFQAHCWGHIPEHSVFSITAIGKKKFELYRKGIIRIDDIPDDFPLSANQRFQVRAHQDKRDIFDKDKIASFLSAFVFPLYFLDFETYQQAVPQFKGIIPYKQIPFQYSLHILDADGVLTHKEFLAKEGEDPRRALAETLVSDIPAGVCTVAYNISFEKKVLRDLAELFPDKAVHLMEIHDNMVDLMVPFQKKWLYRHEMKGSYSIKNVLPALFPYDTELDYNKLAIQNGSIAMDIYQTLHLRHTRERKQIRDQLLAYCKLDTLALVRIYQKLRCQAP